LVSPDAYTGVYQTGSMEHLYVREEGEDAGVYVIETINFDTATGGLTISTIASMNNYIFIIDPAQEATLTITKVNLNIAFDSTETFPTEALSAITVEYVSGIVNNAVVQDTFSTSLFLTGEIHLEEIPMENGLYLPGYYAITQDYVTTNYNVIGSGVYHVKGKEVYVTPLTNTKVYGDADPFLEYSLTIVIPEEGITPYSTGDIARVAGENVGSYAYNIGDVELADSGTFIAKWYEAIFITGYNFTITRRNLVITPNNTLQKTYGQYDSGTFTSGWTYEGLQFNETVYNIHDYYTSVNPMVLTRDPGQNVGEYDLHASTMLSYLLNENTGIATGIGYYRDFVIYYGFATSINPKNYNITFAGGTFKINKATIYIAVQNKNSFFDEEIVPLTYTYTSGVINNTVVQDTYEMIDGVLYINSVATNILLSTIAAPYPSEYSLPGTYPITSSGTHQNYNFIGSGTYTIKAGIIYITPNDGTEKEYGSTDPAFGYTLSTDRDGNTVTVSGALGRNIGESVRTYNYTLGTIALVDTTGTWEMAPWYTISLVTGHVFTIYKAQLVIQLQDKTKIYGDPVVPGYSYVYVSGLQNGDIWSSLIINGTASTAATINSDVDEYPITGTYTTANYTITAYDAIYYVTPATVIVRPNPNQQKRFGTADPVFLYTWSNGRFGQVPIVVGLLGREAGEERGIYEYTDVSLELQDNGLFLASNYILVLEYQYFTIIQGIIYVTPDALTKTFGDADPVFTYILSLGAAGETALVTGDLSRISGEAVGYYAYTIGTLTLISGTDFVSEDYILILNNINLFRILGNIIYITPISLTKVYGDADPAALTYTATGFPAGVTPSDALAGYLVRAVGENVGSYLISVGTLTLVDADGFIAANYTLSYSTLPTYFYITPRQLIITPTGDNTKIYGDDEFPIDEYIITGSLPTEDPQATGALDREDGENVGGYPINIGGVILVPGGNFDPSNYELVLDDSQIYYFNITPRDLIILPLSITKVFGELDQDIPYMYYNLADSLIPLFEGSLGREAGENVGQYLINLGDLVLLDNGLFYSANYNVILDPSLAYYFITPRQIYVIPSSVYQVYGDPSIPIPYTISGYDIPSENIIGELGREEGENVGQYLINIGTLGLIATPSFDTENYIFTISTIPSYYFITPRNLVISVVTNQHKVYGDLDTTIAFNILSGLLNNELVGFDGQLLRQPGEDVGSYKISLGTLTLVNYGLFDASNYLLDFDNSSSSYYTILPRQLVVTPTDSLNTKVYGSTSNAIVYTYYNLANDETPVFIGSLTRLNGEDASKYLISLGTLAIISQGTFKSTNYKLVLENNHYYTITKKDIVVTPSTDTFKFIGQKDTEITFSYVGVLFGQTPVFIGSLARYSGDSEGSYLINAGDLTLLSSGLFKSTNYNLKLAEGDYYYHIILPSYLEVASSATRSDSDYIYLESVVTVSTVLDLFTNDNANLKVTSSNVVLTLGSRTTTGDKVGLYVNGILLDYKYIIVSGDINSDKNIDRSDYQLLVNYIETGASLSPFGLKACDLDVNGLVNIQDAAILNVLSDPTKVTSSGTAFYPAIDGSKMYLKLLVNDATSYDVSFASKDVIKVDVVLSSTNLELYGFSANIVYNSKDLTFLSGTTNYGTVTDNFDSTVSLYLVDNSSGIKGNDTKVAQLLFRLNNSASKGETEVVTEDILINALDSRKIANVQTPVLTINIKGEAKNISNMIIALYVVLGATVLGLAVFAIIKRYVYGGKK
jgi:hypothetical protein